MLDKNGRLFGKISIIDALIVVIILGVIGGAVYKFKGRSSPAGQEVIIKFLSDEVPDFAANAVKIGSIARDFDKGSVFGKVIDKRVDQSRSLASNADGKFVASAKPYFASVILTVKGNGIKNPTGGVMFDNTEYLIGKSVTFKFGDTAVYARVYSIDYIQKG